MYLIFQLMLICLVRTLLAGPSQHWNLEEHCGETIQNQDGRPGIVTLTASGLTRSRRGCQVIITGVEFQQKKTELAFYFSQFRMSGSCSRTSVAVASGDPKFGDKTVKGLPSGPFCGHNTTLEQMGRIFVSPDNSLVVTVNWDKTKWPEGTFVLKFYSIFHGHCNEDHGYVMDPCFKSRCIDSDFRCNDVIDACWHHTTKELNSYCMQKDDYSILKGVAFIIGILAALALLASLPRCLNVFDPCQLCCTRPWSRTPSNSNLNRSRASHRTGTPTPVGRELVPYVPACRNIFETEPVPLDKSQEETEPISVSEHEPEGGAADDNEDETSSSDSDISLYLTDAQIHRMILEFKYTGKVSVP